ncbi:hypothetical protein, partial [Klebsiella pneumoniae]
VAVTSKLTALDIKLLQSVPVGVWLEWQSLAGFVDRPRYRCERLVAAGFMNSKVTNPGNPHHGTKFQKIREVTR